MKSAKYEPTAGALAAWLAAKPRSAFVADLYSFTLVGSGPVLRYATSDLDVTVPYPSPVTFDAKTALFDSWKSKSYGHWKVGLDVDTWQVVVTARPDTFIGGQPWGIAIEAGALDGAVVSVDRAFWDGAPPLGPGLPGGSLRGVVNIFTGRVASVNGGRSATVITINSHLELLNVALPRTLYQATCRWSLFSSACGLSAAAFAKTGTLAAGSTQSTLLSGVAAPGGSGTFALGRVAFTSGQNAGIARAVRTWTPGTFVLLKPLPYPVTAGDSFTAYPGCNKGQAACLAFGNLTNFGGMPYVPNPETAQ